MGRPEARPLLQQQGSDVGDLGLCHALNGQRPQAGRLGVCQRMLPSLLLFAGLPPCKLGLIPAYFYILQCRQMGDGAPGKSGDFL